MMSPSHPASADIETRPPLTESSSSEDLEGQEIQPNHSLLLQDTNYTKDTVAASERHVGEKSEKGRQGDGEKPKHVGFWHQELNNVRLHVLKLWARTGKMDTTFKLGH